MNFFKNATNKANEVLSNVSLFLKKDEEELDAMEKIIESEKEKDAKPANITEKKPVSKQETAAYNNPFYEKSPFSAPKKTVIADGVTIDGNLTVDGDIDLAGKLNGDLKATGNVILRTNMTGNISAGSLELNGCNVRGNIVVEKDVTVCKGSLLEGDIKAKRLSCYGKIIGNVVIGEKAGFASGSSIDGNVTTVSLAIEENAYINGSVKMSAKVTD